MNTPDEMNATLALLKPGEADAALRLVGLLHRGGGMSDAEAAEWTRRLLAWRGFVEMGSAAVH